MASENDHGLPALLRAWMNERRAPDLLPYAGEHVADALEMLEFQEREIADAPPSDASASLVLLLKATELERVKFVLANYLRTRLHKIETFALLLSTQTEKTATILSPAELAYLENFTLLHRALMHESAMKHLAESHQQIDEHSASIDMIPRPSLDTAVFVRVCEDIGPVMLPEDPEPVDMALGHLYVLRYDAIKELLLENRVELL